MSGKVSQEVSRFMAGGSLTALSKLKPGCAPDIRPIAVGEVLRRLTGKCLCAVIKYRVINFFEPIQFCVACPMGSEKVIHELGPVWISIGMVWIFLFLKGGFQVGIQLASRGGMHKAFPTCVPLGSLVLWLSPFSVARYVSANITIRYAAGRPTGSFSVSAGLAQV